MGNLAGLALAQNQREALDALQERLLDAFGVTDIILYGSVARGEADSESDIDLLVLTQKPLNRFVRHEITDLVFEINLRFDTNLSTLVVDENSWQTGLVSVLPIHDEIVREGIPL